MLDIRQLLLAVDFAFDRYIGVVSERMQLFKECAEIHPAVSKADLFTQIVAVGRIHAILGVEIADIGSENIECVYRIGFAVQDEIRGVEIDAEIVTVHRLKTAQESHGCFLPCLKKQMLSVFPAVQRDSAHSVAEALIFRVARILRNKPHMGDDVRNAERRGKVRAVA